ncbi:HAD family hydrolase [Thiocystis violacea]|uniref:HAD family hydrolase n=1 Tax=Thiocystis violacea TaxID=13725 RepID=UPI0019051D2C|nr:HAD family hydrolase [Thiocystis violacea]MBK1717688.1 haloacid dehalogenase [Thiocystis violacea]
MPQPPIRLLTFDLDDTLWPCAPVIQAAEEALHRWLRIHAPRLAEAHDVASLRRRRRQLMEEEPRIAHDLGLVRHRSLSALLDDFGYSVQLADAAMECFLDHRNRVEPYADVLPVLRALSERYQLVSVTNGNSNVEVTALRGLFRHSITAAEAGAAKPDPAVFIRALELTGCRPAKTLHLGDDPWLDVEAARALGIAAVWVNRHARDWPDALPPPVLAVANLREFADWLDRA